jgi:hypothetical protein
MVLHSIEEIAGFATMFALAAAGVTLTVYGLRNDRRERQRTYRRRGPRPPAAGGTRKQSAKG